MRRLETFSRRSPRKHNKTHNQLGRTNKFMVSSGAGLRPKPPSEIDADGNTETPPVCPVLPPHDPDRLLPAEPWTLWSTTNAAVPDAQLTPPPPPIWNPSGDSGRRGRTVRLLMYSQCWREAFPTSATPLMTFLGSAFVIWWNSWWKAPDLSLFPRHGEAAAVVVVLSCWADKAEVALTLPLPSPSPPPSRDN